MLKPWLSCIHQYGAQQHATLVGAFMRQTDILESAIFQELARVGTCTFQELREKLPYSWNQVFAEMDRLTREGTVAIKHPGPVLCLSRSHCVDLQKRAT
jgi:hypothetical protein